MAQQGKKVFLGLSGGVDSAVAGALLLEQGYKVVPVFLKCWEGFLNLERGTLPAGACPWEEDQAAALAVAEKLGIAKDFRSWNFSQEFFQNVVQYLVDEALEGRTGNPDVVCNRTIKFGAFLDRALTEGADFVATGHYSRVKKIQNPKSKTQNYQLLRPRCAPKNDQTYFLWQLSQEQLSRTLFPIGEFSSKDVVRDEAWRRGLPSADRRSTRGICFVGKVGLGEFLEQYIPSQEGEVVTTEGHSIGRHRGTAFYTLGQRQGIGVNGADAPYYVVEKDREHNRLVVAPPAEAQKLWHSEANIVDAHWISGSEPGMPLLCSAFVRHPQEETVPCALERSAEGMHVRFVKPQWALTPGQSVVLYDGDMVLGGGIIRAKP